MKAINNKHKRYFLAIFLAALFFMLPASSYGDNLVSNIDGKIQTIILHNGDGISGLGFWFDETVLFRQLLDKMDRDVAFVILLGDDTNGDRVKDVLKPYDSQVLPDGTARVKYLTLDVKTSRFYPWARDGYVILKSKNNRLIFQDVGFNRKPFPILTFSDIFEGAEVRAAAVHRGGGNFRTTKDEVFMGMDTILGIHKRMRWGLTERTNETLYSLARDVNEKTFDVFKKQFEAHVRHMHHFLAPDKKLVIPGKEIFFKKLKEGKFKFGMKSVWHSGAQAAYHTDVYLSLGPVDGSGKRIVFIADSTAGAEIVKKMKPEERRAVEQKMAGILVEEGFCAAQTPLTEAQIVQRFQWQKHKLLDQGFKPAKEIAETLDAFAAHLKSLGYHIVRVPYFPNGLGDKGNRNDNVWGICYNYSNVLTEVYGDVKRVYFPVFGFKQMDDAAMAAYRSVGYEIIPIKGLLTNGVTPWFDGAGLDCMTSDIRVPVRWHPKFYKKEKEKKKK